MCNISSEVKVLGINNPWWYHGGNSVIDEISNAVQYPSYFSVNVWSNLLTEGSYASRGKLLFYINVVKLKWGVSFICLLDVHCLAGVILKRDGFVPAT